MKRTIKTYLIIGAVLFGACSKDLGNYNYVETNELTITEGVLSGAHHTQRIYTVTFGDILNVSPVISGSVSGSDLSNLEFQWKIDDQIISTSKDLHYNADESYGKLHGEYTILDKSTSIKKTYNFFVDVVNPYKVGYFILSRKANQDAILYSISGIRSEPQVEEVSIPSLGHLGKDPIHISGTRKYGASASDYYYRINLGVKDATYPISVIDSREFTPILLYNKASMVDPEIEKFEPTQVSAEISSENLYALSGGKLFVLSKGSISVPQYWQDPMDYHAGDAGMVLPYSATNYFFGVFDQKNEMFRVFDYNRGQQYNYTKDNNYATTNATMFAGHRYIAGQVYSGTTYFLIILTEKDGKLYSHQVDMNTTTWITNEVTQIGTSDIPAGGKVGFAYFDYNSKFWFISVGRTIYRASHLGLDLQTYVTLPNDNSGAITYFNIAQNKLLIATNDQNHAQEKSASLYIYNTTDLSLDRSDLYAVEEVVSLFVGI